ncbi:MAG: helix-turn-helix domain-containing protein [Candidatus Aminicenantes bacterium]|nr:helix-turn-helix domain-containing protein [Candidatus Aminicenantes bacterium]
MEMNRKRVLQEAGDKLTQLRKKFNYSRDQMAGHFGVSRNAYYKNEVGMALPALPTLYRIAMENNISMDWFLFGRGPMYYDEKEKTGEIEELKKQLEMEKKKQLEKEAGSEKKSLRAAVDMKPEMKELVEHMEAVPLLYHEVLAHFQRFKVDNKALVESGMHEAAEK